VALQGQGWPHRTDSDGDGAPADLTSWFDPAESREKDSRVQPTPFEGAAC
jgi:murein endopeptidase